jgi:hypothetical protein
MKLIILSLVVGMGFVLAGCTGCGVNGQRCVTGYTYTQTQPGVWVITVQYGS